MKMSIEIVSHELIGFGRRQGLMPRFLKDEESSPKDPGMGSRFSLPPSLPHFIDKISILTPVPV